MECSGGGEGGGNFDCRTNGNICFVFSAACFSVVVVVWIESNIGTQDMIIIRKFIRLMFL